jgi:gamma-glutamyltranspeptidase/glutathione hydrolase
MVATPHLLASQSGVAALRAGGNALDAAIAAAATIAVVYPHMNGLGGDNLWLIHDAPGRSRRSRRGALRGVDRRYAARGVSTEIPTRGGPARSPSPASGRLVASASI